MGNISAHVAVATAIVGYDLLKDELENRQPVARKIEAMGLVGSVAVGDTEVEIRVNGKTEAVIQNTTVGVAATNPGACAVDKDLKKYDIYVPANTRIEALVKDAPGTNDVRLDIVFGRPSFTGARRRTGYSSNRTYRPGAGRRTSGARRNTGMY